MMKFRIFGTALLAITALPLAITAQVVVDPPTQVEEEVVPPTQLVFEREVFSYPRFVRRNPFAPLSSNSAGGPRFEVIALRGIIYRSGAGGSIALFGIGGGLQANPDNTVQAAAGLTRRLRRGQQWGNMRVLEIHSDYVLVEVTEFQLSERHEMRIVRAGQGGSS